jgi:hypothetical protein
MKVMGILNLPANYVKFSIRSQQSLLLAAAIVSVVVSIAPALVKAGDLQVFSDILENKIKSGGEKWTLLSKHFEEEENVLIVRRSRTRSIFVAIESRKRGRSNNRAPRPQNSGNS